jgi:hypothetical protein
MYDRIKQQKHKVKFALTERLDARKVSSPLIDLRNKNPNINNVKSIFPMELDQHLLLNPPHRGGRKNQVWQRAYVDDIAQHASNLSRPMNHLGKHLH